MRDEIIDGLSNASVAMTKEDALSMKRLVDAINGASHLTEKMRRTLVASIPYLMSEVESGATPTEAITLVLTQAGFLCESRDRDSVERPSVLAEEITPNQNEEDLARVTNMITKLRLSQHDRIKLIEAVLAAPSN